MNPLRSFLALCATILLSFVALAPAHALEPRTLVFRKTHDFASVADGAQSAATTVGAPGSVMGDACIATVGVSQALVILHCYISAAGTATVILQNESGGAVDLASTTLRVFIIPRGTR